MDNFEKTVISQYGNSQTLLALIDNFNQNLDPKANLNGFYNTIWNVDTADTLGLDIWGRVVNLPTGRFIYTSPVTVLGNDDFRRLILAKALSNISRTNSPSINMLLNFFFAGRGRVYVNDQGAMQMRYTFEFQPLPWELVVMADANTFLRPAGVQVGILVVLGNVFGFREGGPSYTGFNQAPFVQSEIIT